MHRTSRMDSAAIAAVAFILLFGAVASAEHHTLGDQVGGPVALTAEERTALEPVLPHYYALKGSTPVLQRVVAACADYGCRGAPMGDILGIVVQEMKGGASDAKAADRVIDAMRAVCDRCKEKEIVLSGETIVRGVKSLLETAPPSPAGSVVH